MSRPRIIAIVGIDGSGKSTSARWLAQQLTSMGIPASYHENAGGRRALARIARRFGRTDGVDLLGRTGFVIVEATLRWLAIARSVLTSRLTGRVAVMDRYTYCEYAVMRARGDRGERLVSGWYSIFPVPELTCFFEVHPAVAQRRVDERGTDSEDLAYLRTLDRAYRTLPEFDRWVTIDAGGSPVEVQQAVMAAASGHLGIATAVGR